MATTIITKFGSGAPAASDVVRGELAVDTENGRLYTETSGGAVIEIGLKPSGNIDVTGTVTSDGLTVQTTNGLGALLESTGTSYQYLQFKNTGETNNFIGFVNDDFAVSPANVQKLILTAEGQMGIGTTTPSSYDSRANNLVVGDSGDAGITIFSGASNDARLQFAPSGDTGLNNGLIGYDNANDKMTFATAGSDRMVIDSSGNIGIGTTSPDTMLHLSSATNSQVLRFERTDTTVVADNPIGIIEFEHQDGTDAGVAAKIQAAAENASGGVGLRFETGTPTSITERLRIDSSGNVGIGTTSPSAPLTVSSSSTTNVDIKSTATNGTAQARFTNDARTYSLGIDNNDSFFLYDATGTSTRLTVDSSGNVGIGASSVDTKLHLEESDTTAVFLKTQNSAGALLVGNNSAGNSFVSSQTSGKDLLLETNNTERMRIDSSGNVGIGGTPTHLLHVNGGGSNTLALFESTDAGAAIAFKDGNTTTSPEVDARTNDLAFNTGGAESMRIDSSGLVDIGSNGGASAGASKQLLSLVNPSGTTSTAARLWISGTNATTRGTYIEAEVQSTGNDHDLIFATSASGAAPSERMRITSDGDIQFPLATDAFGKFADNISEVGSGNLAFQVSNTGQTALKPFGIRAEDIRFATGSSERMRIDSSGNLLVGKTSTSFGTDGFQANADGQIWATNASASVTAFNRRTSDGAISVFYKDGSVVGNIATFSSTIQFGQGNVNLRFDNSNDQIIPANENGTGNDDAINLGAGGARFDDIYATNGTIQTSDRNEKQDIEALSDAEQRVAVAAKGLLRKFRWKSSVAENGDDARIHFGIIAQDLQAAFEAEGLDAGRYAMFINSTWTDEETGEERSRMGVRYSELLAFIIAAI